MNKLILFLLVSASTFCYAASHDTDSVDITNPRNTIITAIARSDFGTVVKTLETYPLTQEDKQEFLDMAHQIVVGAIAWRNSHHWHAEFGKEFFKTIGYYLAALASGFATVASAGLVASSLEAYHNPERHSRRLEQLPPIEVTIAASTILAGLTSYFGYKTVQKVIASWMKPSQRLENALRIKDAIFHHNVTKGPQYTPQGVYPIAVGASALSYNMPDTTSNADHYTVGVITQ